MEGDSEWEKIIGFMPKTKLNFYCRTFGQLLNQPRGIFHNSNRSGIIKANDLVLITTWTSINGFALENKIFKRRIDCFECFREVFNG